MKLPSALKHLHRESAIPRRVEPLAQTSQLGCEWASVCNMLDGIPCIRRHHTKKYQDILKGRDIPPRAIERCASHHHVKTAHSTTPLGWRVAMTFTEQIP